MITNSERDFSVVVLSVVLGNDTESDLVEFRAIIVTVELLGATSIYL